ACQFAQPIASGHRAPDWLIRSHSRASQFAVFAVEFGYYARSSADVPPTEVLVVDYSELAVRSAIYPAAQPRADCVASAMPCNHSSDDRSWPKCNGHGREASARRNRTARRAGERYG